MWCLGRRSRLRWALLAFLVAFPVVTAAGPLAAPAGAAGPAEQVTAPAPPAQVPPPAPAQIPPPAPPPAPPLTIPVTRPGSGPAAVPPAPIPTTAPSIPVLRATLVGPTWRLERIRPEDEELGPALASPEATLRFGADGTVHINGGCNEYAGTYRVDGPYRTGVANRVEIDPGALVSPPPRLCEPAVREQEDALLDNLRDVGFYGLTASGAAGIDTATLLGSGGLRLIELRAR